MYKKFVSICLISFFVTLSLSGCTNNDKGSNFSSDYNDDEIDEYKECIVYAYVTIIDNNTVAGDILVYYYTNRDIHRQKFNGSVSNAYIGVETLIEDFKDTLIATISIVYYDSISKEMIDLGNRRLTWDVASANGSRGSYDWIEVFTVNP